MVLHLVGIRVELVLMVLLVVDMLLLLLLLELRVVNLRRLLRLCLG